jgi:thioredoxin 1
MKKIIILLIVLAAVVFTAGCAEENQENSTNTQAVPQETQEGSSVVEVTDLEQINVSLQQGPVLMKIGSENCGPCQAMKPMLQELVTEYAGRAKVISIDVGKSPQLASYFGAGYVPDSTVIVNIKDGEYIYMHPEGYVTTDRFKARITGLWEKDIYEDVLNLALLQAEKDKSQ